MPADQVGVVGGGDRELRAAHGDRPTTRPRCHARDLAGFGLLIVDEVHHLPAADLPRDRAPSATRPGGWA